MVINSDIVVFIILMNSYLHMVHLRLNRSWGKGRKEERKKERREGRKKKGEREKGSEEGGREGEKKGKEGKEAVPLCVSVFSTICSLDNHAWLWKPVSPALIAMTKSSSEWRNPKVFETRLQLPSVIWFYKKIYMPTDYLSLLQEEIQFFWESEFISRVGWEGKHSFNQFLKQISWL